MTTLLRDSSLRARLRWWCADHELPIWGGLFALALVLNSVLFLYFPRFAALLAAFGGIGIVAVKIMAKRGR